MQKANMTFHPRMFNMNNQWYVGTKTTYGNVGYHFSMVDCPFLFDVEYLYVQTSPYLLCIKLRQITQTVLIL